MYESNYYCCYNFKLSFLFCMCKVSAESDKAIKQFNDNEILESSKQEIKEE